MENERYLFKNHKKNNIRNEEYINPISVLDNTDEDDDEAISREILIIKKKIDLIYKKYGEIGLKLIDKSIIDLVQKLESKFTTSILDDKVSSEELVNTESPITEQTNKRKLKNKEIQSTINKSDSNFDNKEEINPLLKEASKMLTSHKPIVNSENTNSSFSPAKTTTSMVEHIDDDDNNYSRPSISESNINTPVIKITPSAEDQGDPAFTGGDMKSLMKAVKMF
jgi:hypothetical protein